MTTLKERWVAALRSGDYKQGRLTLRWKNDKFCCLGVLADVMDPDGWKPAEGYIHDRCKHTLGITVLKTVGTLAGDRELGLSVERQGHLTAMNDDGESFEVIADWIEANL